MRKENPRSRRKRIVYTPDTDDGDIYSLTLERQERDSGSSPRGPTNANSWWSITCRDALIGVLDEQQMDRRQRVQGTTDPERHLYFYTPEDILLQKLNWYRAGHEVSDRQWRDVLGIVLVQTELNEAYLRAGAQRLGVVDLLERAMLEGRRS